MRRTEAARYARWAATAAMALAVLVAVVYGYRAWQAAQARKQAPPAVPPTVQKRSAEFAFSKVEGDRTLFTVRASRSTEFKKGGTSLLEDVWITIYGHRRQRFDNIHTRECTFEPATGRVGCKGEVQIDLESAEEARQRPGERVLHLGTANVAFERETGEASTNEPVVFRFPYGRGRAVGVTYSTSQATVRLHREVEITLTENERSGAPIVLTAASLDYHRDTRTLRLHGPVRVRQGSRELAAGALALELDTALRARRLVASDSPQLSAIEPRGRAALGAEEISAFFHREGWAEKVVAGGNVNGTWKDATGEDRVRAARLEVQMEPGNNEPREMVATNARLDSDDRSGTRRLETAALRLVFASGGRAGPDRIGGGRHISHGETLAAASIELRQGEETTSIRGERLAAEFDAHSRMRQLAGRSGVEVERRSPGRAAQRTTSQELAAKFDAAGDWTELEQSGSVRFREGERTAEAQRAQMVRATDTLTLTGAVVADAAARTTAPVISMNQRSGEIRGEGGVRTTYLAGPLGAGDAPVNLAPQPAHIAAEQLLANRSTGRALYSRRARLWQGDAVIEAETIELLREEKRLNARGRVQGLFPQAAGAGEKRGEAAKTLWQVRGETLSYASEEGRARVEGSVRTESRLARIHSRSLELFLARGPGGAQQVSRAVATGGVTVWTRSEGEERRATAERGEYVAAEGKFVLTGGPPVLYDVTRGTTTGRQLTFFFADDKIIVESEEGTRTLTKHRVEK